MTKKAAIALLRKLLLCLGSIAIFLILFILNSKSSNKATIYVIDTTNFTRNSSSSSRSKANHNNATTQSQSNILPPEISRAYLQDGIVAIRGLIPPQMLEKIRRAGEVIVQEQREKVRGRPKRVGGTQFQTVKVGAVFLDPHKAAAKNGACGVINDSTNRTIEDGYCPAEESDSVLSAFREVALRSFVPSVAHELLSLETGKRDNNLRMLKDVFLTKDDDPFICGWHVDDYGFWPASPSSPGVNAWIALDSMPTSAGGGFALVPSSHRAPYFHEAHTAIGSVTTFPPEGFQNASDMFSRRTGGTCNLKTSAPRIHSIMEKSKRIYEVQAGDVIFHTRWIFHRTVPFLDGDQNPNVLKRYSVRYAPGTATLPKGYGVEPSTLYDEQNAGKSLEDVNGGPWYPRVFPSVDEVEMEQMEDLVRNKFPIAEAKLKERKKEMAPHRRKMGEMLNRRGRS